MTRRFPAWSGPLFILFGLLLFLTWGFRTYVLFLNAPGDRFLIIHSLITIISLGSAALLCLIGWRAWRRCNRPYDTRWLIIIGLWISGIGLNRLISVLMWPAMDPNPRAHVHLSLLFITIGLVLMAIVSGTLWRVKQQSRPAETSPFDPVEVESHGPSPWGGILSKGPRLIRLLGGRGLCRRVTTRKQQ